jgi:hypothetical protein
MVQAHVGKRSDEIGAEVKEGVRRGRVGGPQVYLLKLIFVNGSLFSWSEFPRRPDLKVPRNHGQPSN